MKKTISLYVPDGYGGYGDFLFALKVIADLQKRLEDEGYEPTIYLVTEESGREKIQKLGGDVEFGVTVLSVEEYKQIQQRPDFKLDCFILGPVLATGTNEEKKNDELDELPAFLNEENNEEDMEEENDEEKIPFNVCKYLEIPKQTPILLLPEYSSQDYRVVVKGNDDYPNIQVIVSGVGRREKGILFTKELRDVRKEIEEGRFSFRKEYWEELGELGDRLRLGLSMEEYHSKYDMSAEYSKYNECEHVMRVDLIVADPIKNHDFISIGEYEENKRNALKRVLKDIIEKGFGKVVIFDWERGMEETIYDNQQSNQTIYRLIHIERVTHRYIIALTALSGPVMGVTGNQSLGEALSAGKIIVYEWLIHTVILACNLAYGIGLYSPSWRENNTVRELAELLVLLKSEIFENLKVRHGIEYEIKRKYIPQYVLNRDFFAPQNPFADSAAGSTKNNHYERLKELLSDLSVIKNYHAACLEFFKTRNLADEIFYTVVGLLNSSTNNEIFIIFPNPILDFLKENLAQIKLYIKNEDELENFIKSEEFGFTHKDIFFSSQEINDKEKYCNFFYKESKKFNSFTHRIDKKPLPLPPFKDSDNKNSDQSTDDTLGSGNKKITLLS